MESWALEESLAWAGEDGGLISTSNDEMQKDPIICQEEKFNFPVETQQQQERTNIGGVKEQIERHRLEEQKKMERMFNSVRNGASQIPI